MRGYLGQAVDRLRIELALIDNAQAPGPLGDQHAAIGHKRDRPGMLEAFDDLDDAEAVLLGLVGLRKSCDRKRKQ